MMYIKFVLRIMFFVLPVLLAGCANAPAVSSSGVRLIVTVRFNGPVNSNYYYFFVIRNAADSSGQNGPIPVVHVPYGGNGFATGLHGSAGSFTDFVEYGLQQMSVTSSGYTLYHVLHGMNGDPGQNAFLVRGQPVSTLPPAGGNILQFALDLTQIAPDISQGDPDPNNGLLPRYLQVNMITTTSVPVSTASDDPYKVTDAFGDQSTEFSGSFNTYLTIDTSQKRLYQSSDATGIPENANDTFNTDGKYDPAVDMTYWSIQIDRT